MRGAVGQFSFHTGGRQDCRPELLTACYTDTFLLTGKRFDLVRIRVQLHPVLVCFHGLSDTGGWERAKTSLWKQAKCLIVWKLELDQSRSSLLQCSDKMGKMDTHQRTQVARWDSFGFCCALVFCLSDPGLVKCISNSSNPHKSLLPLTCTATARKVVPIYKEGFSLVNM